MQKKKYIKPEIEEVDLTQPNMILCASGDDDDDGFEMGSVISTEFNKQV